MKEKDKHLKIRQKQNFDSHHGVRELPPLAQGDTVWVPDRESQGTTQEEVAPHSYEVTTSDGTYHRNRRDLIRMDSPDRNSEIEQMNSPDRNKVIEPATNPDSQNCSETQIRRSNKTSRPPSRFDPS